MPSRLVLAEDTSPVTCGKLVAIALAVEFGRLRDGAVVGHADRQPALADAQVEPRRRLRRPLSAIRSLPVMPMSMAPSAQSTGMSSVRRNVMSIGISRQRANRLRSWRRKLRPASFEQFGGEFGEAALAGNADAEVFGH